MEQRVADSLLRRLAELRRVQSGAVVRYGPETSEVSPDLDEADGAIAAFAALGLLAEADADAWRQRFATATAAAKRGEPRPSRAVRDRVARYLSEGIERLPSRTSGGLEASWPLQNLLNDFHHIGLLSEREMGGLFDRLGERLDAGDARNKDEPDRNCLCADIRRVVLGPPERHGGVRVTSFELYEDGVAIRWHMVRLAPDESGVPPLPDEVEGVDAARRAQEPHLTLHDDVGTRYRFQSGGGGGGNGRFSDRVRKGTETFTPAVPAQASTLWALHSEYRFEVAL